MPLLRRDLANPLCTKVVKDASANATEEEVQASSTIPRFYKGATGSSVAFLRVFDLTAAACVVGTNAPDFIWKFPASTTTTLVFLSPAHTFSTAFTFAATNAAGVAGNSNPAQTFAVTIGIE